MDVVALEGDLVTLTDEEQSPVVLAIARGRPIRDSIELAVGDGDASVLLVSRNDELTSSQGDLDVIDPDVCRSIRDMFKIWSTDGEAYLKSHQG